MITAVKNDVILGGDATPRAILEYRGLSTDAKPVGAINGSAYIEIDTGKVYLFDAAGATWNEI